MIKKIFISLVLVSSLVLFFYWQKPENNKHNPVIPSQAKKNGKQKIIQEPIASKTTTANKKVVQTANYPEKELSKEIQNVVEILSNHKYSNEPLIEFLSIFSEIQLCKKSQSINYLNNNKDINTQLKLSLHEQCDNLEYTKTQFYNFKSKRKLMLLLLSEPMQSENTQQFATYIQQKNEKEGLEFLFNLAINSKSAPLIIMQTNEMKVASYLQAISTQLATQNQAYIKLIGKQALQMFSCQYQQGITCSNTSPFMLNHCQKDQNLCGKDSNYWFNHYISKAHKADIEMIINWLNQSQH